jgi:hypothetical protein
VTNPAAETIVRASCAECGDVELALAGLSLRVCVDDGQGTYAFDCPICGERVIKPAAPTVVQVLLSAGLEMETWTLPAELAERPSGPPISHDDLLEFHLTLQDPGWFGRLAASVDL